MNEDAKKNVENTNTRSNSKDVAISDSYGLKGFEASTDLKKGRLSVDSNSTVTTQ